MKNYYKYTTSICMLLIIFIFPIASTIKTDNKNSYLEGRSLQGIPRETNYLNEEGEFDRDKYNEDLLNGDYFRSWDDYFSDQIILRGTMVNKYTEIQKKTNKKYINGVYWGDDDYLFSISNNSVDYIDVNARIDYFNSLSKEFENSEIYIASYPSKDVLYSDKVPIGGYKSLEKEYLDKILQGIDSDKVKVLDFYNIFKGKENLYYKTDHHWNMNGAFLAYENIINTLRQDYKDIKEPNSIEKYNIETYEECFVGSDGRKIGQTVNELEDIQLYRFNEEDNLEVTVDGETGQLYHTEYISSDKYNNDYVSYLKGDNGETKILNNKANNDISIVVVGESMDNPLIPIMSEHFRELYSFDLRHYKDDINTKIHEINPDIILINGLPGGFLSSNSNLFKIK